ncbi:MAG: CBS domain-containing protein [Betaproteobacteria bacterium]
MPASTVAKLLTDATPFAGSVTADTPAIEAVRTMARLRLDALLVLDGDRVVGIFSARDFADALANGVADCQPVSAMMAACAIHAAPDDTVDQCLTRMAEVGLRYLPIVDGGKAVGILSLESLLRETADHHARVYEASELDHRIMFLRGTYSC